MSTKVDETTAKVQPAKKLNEKITFIKEIIGKSDDLVVRPFTFGTYQASLIYIDGLVDSKAIQKKSF